MEDLSQYISNSLEINKNEELYNFLESFFLLITSYKNKLEHLMKQTALDEAFIYDKTVSERISFSENSYSILCPYHILTRLTNEDKKIESFFNSDVVFSFDSRFVKTISDYRKLTSFARNIFEELESISYERGDFLIGMTNKERLEILNEVYDVIKLAFVEYSTLVNEIDSSVKKYIEQVRKSIDIGSNAK